MHHSQQLTPSLCMCLHTTSQDTKPQDSQDDKPMPELNFDGSSLVWRRHTANQPQQLHSPRVIRGTARRSTKPSRGKRMPTQARQRGRVPQKHRAADDSTLVVLDSRGSRGSREYLVKPQPVSAVQKWSGAMNLCVVCVVLCLKLCVVLCCALRYVLLCVMTHAVSCSVL